jgi:centromeric protein E
VFVPGTSTQEVYDTTAKPIVLKALDGYHGYIFAYGQTSSGKTYTMLGTPESPGIIQLSLQDIFSQARPEACLTTSFSSRYAC